MSVDVLLDVRAQLGEGPRWDAAAGALLWVDIEGRTLHRYDGAHEAIPFDSRIGCANPTDDGDVLVALADRLALASTGEELARFPHAADVRANDGACDPQGRLWVGTMALDLRPGAAALYRFDGTLVPVLEGLTLANGVGWRGGRMWFVDSLTYRVDEYAYDGDLGARRTFVTIDREDGIPDGLAVDDEGGVWVALHGGSAVRRYSPEGDLDRVVAMPAENPTACCFGGADGRTLYVTTAAPDGRVYATDAGVSGPPAQPFRRTAPSEAEPTSAR